MQLKRHQTGISFFGMLFVGIVLAAVFIVGAKVVPTAVEYMAIQKAVNKASLESSPQEARNAFNRAAAIDDFSSLRAGDLQIVRDGDRLSISYSYNREIELIDPAYLLIKYSGRSRVQTR